MDRQHQRADQCPDSSVTKVRGLWTGGGFDKVLGICGAARANAIGPGSDAGAAISRPRPRRAPTDGRPQLQEARRRRGRTENSLDSPARCQEHVGAGIGIRHASRPNGKEDRTWTYTKLQRKARVSVSSGAVVLPGSWVLPSRYLHAFPLWSIGANLDHEVPRGRRTKYN